MASTLIAGLAGALGRNTTSVALSNGVLLPLVGFGCAGMVRRDTLKDALSVGYELFDTAQASEWYLEAELGHAIVESGADRSKLFLTSKLHPRDLGESATLAAFPRSLDRLHTSYLDCFMLHYPRCFGDLCHGKVEADGDWRGAWRALEALYDRGDVRAIGVCNFGPEELRELLAFARVKPHLVQSWMDPLQQARQLRSVCAEAGVTFQAYSSLGTQHRTPVNPVLKHPTITRIAEAVGRSTAQVALRWALQRDAAVIPRSTRRTHIEANLALWDFELSPDQMAQVDALDGTDPRAAVPPAPPKLCPDEHRECEQWAAAGECEANPGFMHSACAGSCGTCGNAAQHVEL